MKAATIIEKMGGREAVAALFGLTANVVWRWEHEDWIPPKRQAALIAEAKKLGFRLSVSQFPVQIQRLAAE